MLDFNCDLLRDFSNSLIPKLLELFSICIVFEKSKKYGKLQF